MKISRILFAVLIILTLFVGTSSVSAQVWVRGRYVPRAVYPPYVRPYVRVVVPPYVRVVVSPVVRPYAPRPYFARPLFRVGPPYEYRFPYYRYYRR